MSTAGSLRKKINPAIVMVAKVQAAKRAEKYMHAHARRRFRARIAGESPQRDREREQRR
jgi:hypothetical protein